MPLTHFDDKGHSRMVDISEKGHTRREAIAKGTIILKEETIKHIKDKSLSKGDVFEVARLAAIMAAKKTPYLIPLCHPIPLTSIDVSFTIVDAKHQIDVEARVRCTGQTGVEMEALTAVSVASLTVYDMCKAVDRGMIIKDIHLLKKSGGKSGLYQASI
ncbi:MAG: cyclic pyranopterin monophosphate synthase MoaC [bacterium]